MKTFLWLILLTALGTNNSLANTLTLEINKKGDEIILTADQIEEISIDLERKAETESPEVARSLNKISKSFAELSDSVRFGSDKNIKKKMSLKSIIRGGGKASTFLSIAVLKPFVNVASFFTGLFEKPGKNQDAKAFLEFFLNHEKELDEVWRNTGTVENFAQSLKNKVEDILLEKQIIIITDLFKHYVKIDVKRESILKSLGIKPYNRDDTVKTLQELAFDHLGPELMFFEIDPDLINDHDEYQELKPLIGEISGSDLDSIMTFRPDFDLIDLGNRSRIQLHEGLIAFSSKIFVPKIAIGIVSKSIASVVTGVSLISDIGFATSSLVCLKNQKVQAKIAQKDADLVNFCSYIINRSAYKISKSRAKGYVKGKNFRRTLIKKTEGIKRTLRRKERN